MGLGRASSLFCRAKGAEEDQEDMKSQKPPQSVAAKGVKRSHGEMSIDAGKAHSNAHDGGNIVAKPKFDFDLDTLDCTICMEHFSPPVFQLALLNTAWYIWFSECVVCKQCQNGHLACSACCKQLTKGCPSCSEPIGVIRNLAIEKIIESLQVSCEHVAHGCNEMLKLNTRQLHESRCKYIPLKCPITTCTYHGPRCMYSAHFSQNHNAKTVHMKEWGEADTFTVGNLERYVLLEAEDEYYLLHHVTLPAPAGGRAFFITSFVEKRIFHIQISFPDKEMTTLYSMETPTVENQKPEDWMKHFLSVPKQPQSSSPFEVSVRFLNDREGKESTANCDKGTDDQTLNNSGPRGSNLAKNQTLKERYTWLLDAKREAQGREIHLQPYRKSRDPLLSSHLKRP